MRLKFDPSTGIIDQILEDDSSRPRKQRRTARRICEQLRDEYGFAGDCTIAATLVHELIEARDEKRLLRLQQELAKIKLHPGRTGLHAPVQKRFGADL